VPSAGLLPVCRPALPRLVVVTTVSPTVLARPAYQWLHGRCSVVWGGVREQCPLTDLGVAVACTSRLAASVAGLSSSDPLTRTLCKLHLAAEVGHGCYHATGPWPLP
jgi:hypothetical protein